MVITSSHVFFFSFWWKVPKRETQMFIGTQFSNLYNLVDTSARGRVGVCVVCVCNCVSMYSDVLGSPSL